MAQILGHPIRFRNELFRPREVKLTLKQGNPDNSQAATVIKDTDGQPLSVNLREVASIESTTTGASAMGMGPVKAIMQSWYYQPISLNIAGRSYFGAFNRSWAGPDMNVAIDKDIEALKKIRAKVNALFCNSFEPLQNIFFELYYGDPTDPADSLISSFNDEYIGLADEFNISEGETEPFIKTYRFHFVGEPKGVKKLQGGADGAKQDKKILDYKMADLQDLWSKWSKLRIVGHQ